MPTLTKAEKRERDHTKYLKWIPLALIAVGILALVVIALVAWVLGLIYQGDRFGCDVTSCPLSLPAHDGGFHRPSGGAGTVLICHNPGPNQVELLVQNGTFSLGTSLEAHLGHGDTLGECFSLPPPTAPPPTVRTGPPPGDTVGTFDPNGTVITTVGTPVGTSA